jgi:hypothetical protein
MLFLLTVVFFWCFEVPLFENLKESDGGCIGLLCRWIFAVQVALFLDASEVRLMLEVVPVLLLPNQMARLDEKRRQEK